MLYTAQFSYKGLDRYDITAKTKNIFAPAWDIVEDFKRSGNETQYTELYTKMMRASYGAYPQLWSEMVRMCTEGDVTLVCYCKSGAFCHRLLLAEYLQKCGVVYGGERGYKHQSE